MSKEPLVITIIEEIVGQAILVALGGAIMKTAADEKFDQTEVLLALRRQLMEWVDRESATSVQRAPPVPDVPAPPAPKKVAVSLADAIKWYQVREGRSVKIAGNDTFQIEGRDDATNLRGLVVEINRCRRRANADLFEITQ